MTGGEVWEAFVFVEEPTTPSLGAQADVFTEMEPLTAAVGRADCSRARFCPLARRAAASGQDLPSYIAQLVTHFAEPSTPLDELSGPICECLRESGMTDDELGDLLERAKHQMRTRRPKSRPAQ